MHTTKVNIASRVTLKESFSLGFLPTVMEVVYCPHKFMDGTMLLRGTCPDRDYNL